jgi:hypothetical protein
MRQLTVLWGTSPGSHLERKAIFSLYNQQLKDDATIDRALVGAVAWGWPRGLEVVYSGDAGP